MEKPTVYRILHFMRKKMCILFKTSMEGCCYVLHFLHWPYRKCGFLFKSGFGFFVETFKWRFCKPGQITVQVFQVIWYCLFNHLRNFYFNAISVYMSRFYVHKLHFLAITCHKLYAKELFICSCWLLYVLYFASVHKMVLVNWFHSRTIEIQTQKVYLLQKNL